MISHINPLILAVHIGHDASASVLRDGQIVGHALRERHSKVRHHLGIDRSTIEIALGQSGLTIKDVDVVAVTATQQIPNIVNDPDWFSFSEQSHNDDLKPFRLNDNPWWKDAENFIVERWREKMRLSMLRTISLSLLNIVGFRWRHRKIGRCLVYFHLFTGLRDGWMSSNLMRHQSK